MINITLPDSNFRYGISNRPSTPMKNVIGNYYGIEAELEALQRHHYEIERVLTIFLFLGANQNQKSNARKQIRSIKRRKEQREDR